MRCCSRQYKSSWQSVAICVAWNGFMKAPHDGPCPSKTAIHLEPMTDMPSSDYSCIYLIMPLESDLARKYGHDPILTFD